jgi:hypothetical protein
MAVLDFTPAGTLRKLAEKRNRPQDDLVADYMATITKPGDRTLQLGASEFGAVFLQRGAFHEMVAPTASIEGLQALCERRAIRSDRLRGTASAQDSNASGGLDAVLISSGLGFPALAGNWRGLASRLRLGGVLILIGADSGGSARLADALMGDEGWALQEMIAGEAAVFRKIGTYDDRRTRDGLSAVADPARKPSGVRPGLFAGLMRTLFGSGAVKSG